MCMYAYVRYCEGEETIREERNGPVDRTMNGVGGWFSWSKRDKSKRKKKIRRGF